MRFYQELPPDVQPETDEWEQLLGPNFEGWALTDLESDADRSLRCPEVQELLELRIQMEMEMPSCN